MGDPYGRDGFVDSVYESAIDPGLWPSVLERLADLTGGGAAAVKWQHIFNFDGVSVDVRLDPAAAEQYFGHFARLSPLAPPTDSLRRSLPGWSTHLVKDDDRMPKAEFVRTEFYNDFFRRFDIHSHLEIGLDIEGDHGGTLDLMRPERLGPFTPEILGLCAAVQPHLIRAFRLGRRFAAVDRVGRTLGEVFDASPHGLILLDPAGRVRHMNRAATALVAAGEGLRLIGGRLTAERSDAARRLEALVARAGAGDRERRSGGAMGVATPGRRRPLSVIVAPIRAERFALFVSGPTVVVCVTDLDAAVRLPEDSLRVLFGLSAAEGRVAMALFEGLSPRETGHRLGLSFNTVRVHLAHILHKTGAGSQVELARLMMRVIGVGPDLC